MIVLIVEDEEAVTCLWRSFLKGIACAVRVAHDLPEALRLMRIIPCPDVVLLDLKLPGSSPMNTLEHIAAFKEICQNVIVIVISGHPDERLPELALTLGAEFFAPKMKYGGSQSRLLTAIKEGIGSFVRRGHQPAYTPALEMLERLTELTAAHAERQLGRDKFAAPE